MSQRELQSGIHRFGVFEMDIEEGELRRRGVKVPIQEMPLRLLGALVENPGLLVSRDELRARFWPQDAYGLFDDNLNTAVRKLRVALGDSARNPRFVETVPRRGYRFIAPVEQVRRAPPGSALQPDGPGVADEPAARDLSHLFVGREPEMDELRGALQDCLAGRGRLVVLSGEAGIGKTRIAQQLAEEARQLGLAACWGKNLEQQGGSPYWPWVQILRSIVEASDEQTLRQEMGPGAADIAGILPRLGERLRIAPAPALGSAEQTRFRLFDSVAGYLGRVAARQPLLLIFDNLHFADRSSLLLLEFLVPAIAESRALILGTYRGSEVSRRHPLFDTLGALNRERFFVRRQLRGLDLESVARFLDIAAETCAPRALVEAIHQQTEGNPFFISEVVRLLIDEKILVPQQGVVWPRRDGSLVIRIPEGVRETLGRRFNRLSQRCNRILSAAAVVGREFRVEVLRVLLDGLTEEELLAGLEEAAAAGIIHEGRRSARRYRFSHALIRETLHDELSAAQRARCHARIGEALERIHASDLEAHLPQLAHRFFETARWTRNDKAVEYAARAGAQAEGVFAYDEAATFYEMALEALELIEPVDEVRRCRLLLALARSLSKGGRIHEALELLDRATALGRRLESADALVGAVPILDYAVSAVAVAGAQAAPHIEEALTALGEGDSAARARLLGALARACYNAGWADRAAAAMQRSIAMARRVGDPAALCSALRAKLYARYPPQNVEDRLADAYEMSRLAEVLGDAELQRDAHELCFYDHLEKGDLDAADRHLVRSSELGEMLRQPLYIHNHLVYRAMRMVLEGRYREGERLALQALRVGERVRRDSAEGIFGIQMFAIRRDQGRLSEVAGAVDAFTRSHAAEAIWRPGLALLYSELGLADKARRELDFLARDEFAAVPRDALWCACLAYLSEVAGFLGDRERAEELYGLLEPYDGNALTVGACVAFLGAVSYYRGVLAHTLARLDEAATHFEDALALTERMGARPWVARAQQRLGALLLERRASGDVTRAREYLESSLASARALGMQVVARCSEAQLARTAGRRREATR